MSRVNRWRRLASSLIDSGVVGIVSYILVLALGGIGNVLGIAASAAYFTYFHGSTGQTPGNAALGIRVVDVRDRPGRPIGYNRATLRWLVSIVSGLALTIGYLTEPLPREGGRDHPDLRARMGWLEQVDAQNFDRIVSFDPLIADTAANLLPVWRSLPIPVADSLYMGVRPRAHPPSLLFIGRSTAHREELLAPIKRKHAIVHIGHGLFGEQLLRFLRRADVQLNLHNNPYPSFENRVCVALAAGQLVISEPLSPRHELRPGIDYLEIDTPAELLALTDHLAEEPDAYADVQAAGHSQAERFRASRIYPQLIRDALADVEARGSRRRA